MPVSPSNFVIIGENIHCTRKLKRGGKRSKSLADGTEVIVFSGPNGSEMHLPIPEAIRSGQAYAGGMIPHVAAAVELGLGSDPRHQRIGRQYIQWLAQRQLQKGAAYLDVNVDEISPDMDRRNQAMQWIVPVIQAVSDKPLSIDSSQTQTLQAGLEAHDAGKAGRPMLNSASLERPETVELAHRHDCATVVMSSGTSGMPTTADERLTNIRAMMERCRQAGLQLAQLYIDPLVFPASASPESPPEVLETIRRVRAEYGPAVHIAGGHSNVSFGLPMRRLLNAVWIHLAIEAGVDSGLIDPITSHPGDIAQLETDGETFQLARAGFLGEDPYFMNFIEAWRAGRLTDPFAAEAA
jgi:5-methyltetrahydrofolate--homocysteine methyltransferase